MAHIRDNVSQIIGKTPLVRLQSISRGLPGTILAKLESQNPMRSIKDRAAHAMIESGEHSGRIGKKTTIIEATSGNTGIALAFICAAKGYPLVIVTPENTSMEKRQMLEALGVRVLVTPAHLLMKGAIDKAMEIQRQLPDSHMPMQFDNPANAKAHFDSTGPEIWQDTDGEIDHFVAGVGTGGTITGVGQYLKNRKSTVRVCAVEPALSAVLSGQAPGHHQIQGIGAGFIPPILDTSIYDEVIQVRDEDAMAMCRRVAKSEGLLIGISSGANLCAAHRLASREENADKLIVTIFCDTGERYLSTGLFHNPGPV